jgi:hypothetical protein
MYYHCRPLKYVEYSKVEPYKNEDNWLNPCYDWLGHHCGYSPQIWLSRSSSFITGYRSSSVMKKRKNVISKRKQSKINKDSVLFGFEDIKGFPVSYEHWCLFINDIMNHESFQEQNESIKQTLDEIVGYYDGEIIDIRDMEQEISDWLDANRDLDVYLKKYVFVEKDQVVVPSLNLKSAKKILCRNEKQKKKLRKMGFIEDRIYIKNLILDSF